MDDTGIPKFFELESEMEVLGIKKIVDSLPSLENVRNPIRNNGLQEILNHYRYRSPSEASTVSNSCSSDDESSLLKRAEGGNEQINQKTTMDANKTSMKEPPKIRWEYLLADNESLEEKSESEKGNKDEFTAENQTDIPTSSTEKSNIIDDNHFLEKDECNEDSIQELVTTSKKYRFGNDVKGESLTDGIRELQTEANNSSSKENELLCNCANPSSSPGFYYMVRPSSKGQSTPVNKEICLNGNDSSTSSSSTSSSETDSQISEPCNDLRMEERCSDDVLHFLDVRIHHRKQQMRRIKKKNTGSSLKQQKLLNKLLLTKVNYLQMMIRLEKKRLNYLKRTGKVTKLLFK